MHALFSPLARRVALPMLLSAAVSTMPAHAESPAEFFKGREINMLIGGGAGGSVDVFARIVASHIVDHLPGKPSVIPRNLPSAGGIQAFMTLGNTAPRDGSTFAGSARGPLSDPLLSPKTGSFDPRKFIWIGAMNEDSSLCFTGPNSQIKTLEDARKHETTMAATGALAESSKFPLAINAVAGTKFKVITGYRGAAGTKLAVERGEVDGQCTTIGSLLATQPDVLAGSSYHFLTQVGEERSPRLPNVPTVMEFAKSELHRKFLSLLTKPLLISSSFALPAGVPDDRVAIWRDAFRKTIQDPAFVKESGRLGLEVKYRTGEEAAQIVDDLYSLSPETLEFARKVFGYGQSKR